MEPAAPRGIGWEFNIEGELFAIEQNSVSDFVCCSELENFSCSSEWIHVFHHFLDPERLPFLMTPMEYPSSEIVEKVVGKGEKRETGGGGRFYAAVRADGVHSAQDRLLLTSPS